MNKRILVAFSLAWPRNRLVLAVLVRLLDMIALHASTDGMGGDSLISGQPILLGAERVYGAHCHAGDTVGVLLDCDAGRISFFFDGLKYGEHILNDLGCAFENISPFGFNVDGCGSGGAGQGAPSGIEGGRGGRYPAQGAVRPRALWPVVGLRNHGDRVTMSSKWVTSYGVDGNATVNNCLAVDELLYQLHRSPLRKNGSQAP